MNFKNNSTNHSMTSFIIKKSDKSYGCFIHVRELQQMCALVSGCFMTVHFFQLTIPVNYNRYLFPIFANKVPH